MLKTRFIPVLLLKDESLVKTVGFRKFDYIGDPCNTVRIFNELEVDEMILLDIEASRKSKKINMRLLSELANECFMPLGYGGGVLSVEDAKEVFDLGFEKVSVNAACLRNVGLISDLASKFGSQAIVASIDVKRNIWGTSKVYSHSLRKIVDRSPVEWAIELEQAGAGEILLTDVNNEGGWCGYNVPLVRDVSEAVDVPVIAHGGCGSLEHVRDVCQFGLASAVAVGSYVVYQRKGQGVLVNTPSREEIEAAVEVKKV